MAIATAKLKQPVVQPLESITLTLDENEVKALIAVLNRVGGNPHTSARKYTDSIHTAVHSELERVGAEVNIADIKIDVERSVSGSIYFE